MEILKADKLDNIIRGLNFKNKDAAEYEDPELCKLFLYDAVLSKLESGDFRIKEFFTEEELFYSRYYWFNKFVKRHIKLYGPNAGLEQVLFKMLEHYHENSGSGEVDWNIIGRIENDTI